MLKWGKWNWIVSTPWYFKASEVPLHSYNTDLKVLTGSSKINK